MNGFSPGDAKAQKADRLAQALRANLRRRKQPRREPEENAEPKLPAGKVAKPPENYDL